MSDQPADWHPQDWILVMDALIDYAGPPTDAAGSPRQERAWELVYGIAADQGLPAEELVRQTDSDYWEGS